ncbi:pantoate--beta-alanine ligase [Agreia sp. COWG]|uniref:pantoate--beta-alanine ligase n=1 Tax=Agreia sp. COWG TaxID=2773266 RepID=UPI001AF74A5A|nr:pantoate--beta-alanine ligase [Agreia sp. COWG]CAD6006015.1 Pantothenate synthetase [Agreia sp. COWG]
MTETVDSIAGVRALIAREKAALVAAGVASPRVALVPTMGALHNGHVALVERATELAEIVVVSIFVNPTQFNAAEDLQRYPRDLEADVVTLSAVSGPSHSTSLVVFAPAVDAMYPSGTTQTIVSAGRAGNTLEGRSRAGHFDGVLTVVSKLLNIVRPDIVLFGQKDAQQAFLVGRMITDLDIATSIEVVPTVREDDGLALSSRNRFLDERERRASRVLSQMLEAAESAADRGIDTVIAAAQSVAMGEPLVQVDYLAVVDPATFSPVDDDHRGRAIVLVAAKVGSTRLIDNETIYLG